MILQLSQNKKFKKSQEVLLSTKTHLNHVSADKGSNTWPISTSPQEEERALTTWPTTPSNSRDDQMGQLVFHLRPQIFTTLVFFFLNSYFENNVSLKCDKDTKNIRRIWLKKKKNKENKMTGIKSY